MHPSCCKGVAISLREYRLWLGTLQVRSTSTKYVGTSYIHTDILFHPSGTGTLDNHRPHWGSTLDVSVTTVSGWRKRKRKVLCNSTDKDSGRLLLASHRGPCQQKEGEKSKANAKLKIRRMVWTWTWMEGRGGMSAGPSLVSDLWTNIQHDTCAGERYGTYLPT